MRAPRVPLGGNGADHRPPVEPVGQPQHSAALGPRWQPGRHRRPRPGEQRRVGGEGLAEHLREAAAGDEPVGPLRQRRIGEGVEGDELGAGRFEGVEVVAVGKGEGRPGGHRDAAAANPVGEGDVADGQRRRAPGHGHEGVEVAAGGDAGGQPPERRPHSRRVLGDGDEAEVAVAPGEGVVAPQAAEDGHPQLVEGVAQELLVAGGPDTVQHHARQPQPLVVVAVAADHSRHRGAHGRGVDDQHHGSGEGGRHVGGRRRRAVGRAVVEAHHALDDEQVGPPAGTAASGPTAAGPHSHGSTLRPGRPQARAW